MESLARLVNPWELDASVWIAGVVFKEVLLQVMDLAVAFLGRYIKPLPTRAGPKPVYQRPLGMLDALYLAMNAVVETVFVTHLLHYLWYSPKVDRPLASLGLLNGPVSLFLLIIFNDMLYAPMHRLLHTPLLYRWIHKHHHQSLYPSRGNLDARNEHPLEQIFAMALWYVSMTWATRCVGMHAGTVLVHLAVMIFGSCFNHTGHDLSLNFFGIKFEVRAHEMHHRHPTKNFGQLVMCFDHLMGTYTPYVSG